MRRNVLLNGTILSEQAANISVFDKGYYFDFAVYSSIKVVQGRLFFPEYHVERLFESATLIGIEHQFTNKQILAWIRQAVRENELTDALLRLLLVGDPDDSLGAKFFCIPIGGLTFYPDALYRDGASAVTYQGERRFPQAKTKDLLVSFLAYRKATQHGALDALLIDRDGMIREGTRTNFFVFREDTLITPPADSVLEGITRKIVLELAGELHEIREEHIPLSAIRQYDECFITSTSTNVMPIRLIDDIVFGGGFSKTRELQRRYREYCKTYIV